jgi:DNA-binding transcriptional LysR family regulator
MKMDRFEQMAVLVAIAERGGFIGAARHLGVSAASVTRAISALEGTLGTPLLSRTTRCVRLTDAGERYLEEARRLLAELEEIEELGAAGASQLKGLLSITAPKMFGILHVSPLLTEFLRLHPQLRARLLLRDTVIDMKEEAIDVAVRISHAVEPTLICADLGLGSPHGTAEGGAEGGQSLKEPASTTSAPARRTR